MMNRKLRRLGGLFTMLVLLACLLTVSAFAGENERYGYSFLNTDQKALYEQLHDIVAEKNVYEIIIEPDGTVKDWSPAYYLKECQVYSEEAHEAIRMFVADYPEYYWFDGTVGLATYSDGSVACLYNLEYTHVTESAAEKFEDAVGELLEYCPDGSDYEKALYIHDALAEHITYSYEHAHEQSAYSAIVEGKAVCAGYARAYQYLLNCVGIDAWTAEGFGWNPQDGSLESHAWNLVWIDDKCVYTDVTWDDQTDSVGYTYYAYFNRSLDEISKDHMTDSEYVEGWTDYFGDKLPECSHDSESYFVKNSVDEITQISVDSLAANVQKVDDYQYMIHVLYDDFDRDTFTDWLNANASALINASFIDSFWVSGIGFSGLGDELRIFIYTPYEDVDYFDGRIDNTEDGILTAYVCYWRSALKDKPEVGDAPDYETVMVAYYDDNDALISVAFTDLTLDSACRAELTADCPDDFAYCRVFVVSSDSNPNPLCDLLQMEMPE